MQEEARQRESRHAAHYARYSWMNLLQKEEPDRVRLHAKINRSRVWLIGETGHGKTESTGRITKNDIVVGVEGFSHDTKSITEYELNYIVPGNVIQSLVLADTRGAIDTGMDVHYTAKDFFVDMNNYQSCSELCKIVFVVRFGRLQSGLQMISDLHAAFQDNFMILMTGTMSRYCVEEGKLKAKLTEKGINFNGAIMCVENRADVEARRLEILEALETLPSVDAWKLCL